MRSAQQIAEGLNILRWYIDDDDVTATNMDECYILLVGMVSSELKAIHDDPVNADKIALENLGWKWNEWYGCYAYEI